MSLSQAEFDEILADDSKRIIGDIVWVAVSAHSDAKSFKASVLSNANDNLLVEGCFRPSKRKLGISLIVVGHRVAGIDFGSNIRHRNVSGTRFEGAHLQLWSADAGAAEARPLPRGTPGWNQPVEVWLWLCDLLGIVHVGEMLSPDKDKA